MIDQHGVTRLKNQLKKRKRKGEQKRSKEDKAKQTNGRPVRVSTTVPMCIDIRTSATRALRHPSSCTRAVSEKHEHVFCLCLFINHQRVIAPPIRLLLIAPAKPNIATTFDMPKT